MTHVYGTATGTRRTASASPSPRTVPSYSDQTPRLGGRLSSDGTSPPVSGISRRRSISSSRQPVVAEDQVPGCRASNATSGVGGGAGALSPTTPRSRLAVPRKPRPPALSAQAQAMSKAKVRDGSKPLSPPADAPARASPTALAAPSPRAGRGPPPSSSTSSSTRSPPLPQKSSSACDGRSPPGPGAAAPQHALDDDDCWTSGDDDDGLARVEAAAARQLGPGRVPRSPGGLGPWEGASKDEEPEVSNASWASSPVSVQVRAGRSREGKCEEAGAGAKGKGDGGVGGWSLRDGARNWRNGIVVVMRSETRWRRRWWWRLSLTCYQI